MQEDFNADHFTLAVRSCHEGYYLAKQFPYCPPQRVSQFFESELLALLTFISVKTGAEVSILD